MPSLKIGHKRLPTWKARITFKGEHYFLGYYDTREEAEAQEQLMRDYLVSQSSGPRRDNG